MRLIGLLASGVQQIAVLFHTGQPAKDQYMRELKEHLLWMQKGGPTLATPSPLLPLVQKTRVPRVWKWEAHFCLSVGEMRSC